MTGRGADWLKNFAMVVGAGFLLGMVRGRGADLLVPAVLATLLTFPHLLERPPLPLLRAHAWFHTGMTAFLLAQALVPALRVAFWQWTDGLERSAGVMAVAAGGWAVLACAAWLAYHWARESRKAHPPELCPARPRGR